MKAAADYSFNKSHAACYALISYRTAYLKANYPAEYMAAVISSVMNTKDKVPFFVNRCEEMGIEVLPPDVNSSDHGFVVSEKAIRFGLDAVKNVGHSAVEAILRAREEGRFDSIWDFCERVDSRAVNKRAIECLIKCGALDSTGASRKGMLEALPAAQSAGQKAQEDAQLGPGLDLRLRRDGGAARASAGPAPAADLRRRVRPAELLAMEKETLGTYLSSHPLAEVARGAAGAGRLQPRGARRQAGRLLGDGRRHRHRVQEDPHQERQPDDVRDPRRRRGPGRDAGLQGRRGRERGGDRPRRRSSSSAAGSTTRSAARPSSSCRRRSASNPTGGDRSGRECRGAPGRAARAADRRRRLPPDAWSRS